MENEELMKVAEAAHILGFKQRKKIDLLIKEGFLKVHTKKDSKQIWLSKSEVFALPKALPAKPGID